MSSVDSVAIIPARKGSKRIPNKNRLSIGGSSLLQRTVESIRDSGAIARTILTTDDEKLVESAERYPLLKCDRRPVDLAQDQSSTEDVIRYVIKENNLEENTIVLLQLTSPFRTGADIKDLLRKMENMGTHSGVSVCRWRAPPSPPFGTTDAQGSLGMRHQEHETAMRQHHDTAWAVNGAIYIFSAKSFLETGKLYDEGAAIHVMGGWRSLDLDYEDDVLVADAIASYYEV